MSKLLLLLAQAWESKSLGLPTNGLPDEGSRPPASIAVA